MSDLFSSPLMEQPIIEVPEEDKTRVRTKVKREVEESGIEEILQMLGLSDDVETEDRTNEYGMRKKKK